VWPEAKIAWNVALRFRIYLCAEDVAPAGFVEAAREPVVRQGRLEHHLERACLVKRLRWCGRWRGRLLYDLRLTVCPQWLNSVRLVRRKMGVQGGRLTRHCGCGAHACARSAQVTVEGCVHSQRTLQTWSCKVLPSLNVRQARLLALLPSGQQAGRSQGLRCRRCSSKNANGYISPGAARLSPLRGTPAWFWAFRGGAFSVDHA
jgi:hypothetical protein